jgi:hypothetical protein
LSERVPGLPRAELEAHLHVTRHVVTYAASDCGETTCRRGAVDPALQPDAIDVQAKQV